MYISQLVINGFKTFNSKTSLEFGDGITAVVGPNGCGKTNIVDAIRWVLGEQKYSTLRSTRMEDVIFNGAKGTKPLSMCEVYLTVKNDKGKLPVEYTDVEIGRRLYRDGESEYFINKNVCRLRDINNLFIDTGMGADSYSVIELKMIEQILSETDEGRKFLFEEAAGINKYKNQRRLSIKKFEATKFDLERINDIINEVDAKVKGLNLQLKRFKRHATLVEKLKECELDLNTLQINRYLELSKPLRQKIDEYSHLRKEKVSDQDVQESNLVELKQKYEEQETEIKNIRSQISDLDEKREESGQKVLIWQEQNRSAEKDIERLNNETKSNKTRIEKFEISKIDINKEIETLTPKIDEKLSVFKNEQTKFEKLEKSYKAEQTEVDKIQTERWELQKEISDNKSVSISTESTIKERNSLKEKLSQKIQFETELIEKLKNNQIQFDEKIKSADNQIVDLNKKKSTHKNKLEKQEKELTVLINKKQSNELYRDSLQNQLNFYQELVESQSDLPGGLKYILDKKVESEKVLGTVSEMFSADEKYEKAISTALGEFAQSLICSDRNIAFEFLKEIQASKAGRISIIPFNELSGVEIKTRQTPKSDLVIDKANNLIKCDNKYSKIAELLVGNILIVNDLNSAIKNKELTKWTLIDLNGVSYSNSVLRNPSSVKGTTIGRKEKIDDLTSKTKDLHILLADIDKKISNLENQKDESLRQIDTLDTEIKNEIESAEKLKSDYQRFEFEIENKKQVISESKYELRNVEGSVKELEKSISLIQEKITKSEQTISGIKSKLDAANDKLEISRKERDDHHQAMQDIRIELLNLENKRDNLNLQKKTAESTINEIVDRQNKIVDEIKNIKEQINSRISQIAEREKELVGISSELKEKRKKLESKELLYRETYRSIEEIESKIKSEQKSREAILEELKQCEVNIAEYNQQIRSIKERMMEKYEAEVPHDNDIERSEDELQQEIERLERSIENIGPVNMAVQNEYEEEQKRLEHITAQRDDLIESEENLRESIDKIDRVARKQFRETFDQIKANFENLFTIFFEGGQGTLELIGNPDPLEADIAIKAQPPGKRNQTLRMLSAGEKSLTAIALLFAIYQYKPSPYCILDEVDAPLDDANVRKFTRGLKSFTTDTQFIVVTHNKITMEAANYLYGVTMEKKGISKLVSVKFD